ncbi:peptidoglycan recognition protein 1-like isoform X1 [Salmo trutta]|uniref:peptidoglycan recognition protein 1-like isoform X1 n=1 Tax=Salmo trutta TaxID=8032 RepID=UPI0011319135|nr:peptidoglycan recognition protein 1-like isoform X1 [Salmo trutta]
MVHHRFTVVGYPYACISVEVVTRGQWGAAAPRCRETLKYPAQRVVKHHTALLHCGGIQECMDQLIHIQRMHMQDRNFDDIGYNFLIGGDCTVYEGRGWGVVGAHTKGNNHNSLAIAFMGNFNNESPSPAALSSVKQLLQCGVSQGHLHPELILLGDRDLRDTECPGERLYAALKHLKFP